MISNFNKASIIIQLLILRISGEGVLSNSSGEGVSCVTDTHYSDHRSALFDPGIKNFLR